MVSIRARLARLEKGNAVRVYLVDPYALQRLYPTLYPDLPPPTTTHIKPKIRTFSDFKSMRHEC